MDGVPNFNRFADQGRRAFVVGAYYPALTGTCALGERILNHLVLNLRTEFKTTPEYKNVYRKKSFDNWALPIDTLEAWSVLLPEAAEAFRKLKEVRNRRAIHFNPETDKYDRVFALDAVKSLNEIISVQFGTIPPKPWFIPNIKSGGGYIKKEMETDPFVRLVYLPNAYLVGPEHYLDTDTNSNLRIFDREDYEDREISDDEFVKLLERAREERLAKMQEVQKGPDAE